MKKTKILLILSLSLLMASCSNSEYVSKRHPEASDVNEELTVDENETVENNGESQEEDQNDQEGMGVTYKVNDVVNIRLDASTDSNIVGQAYPKDEILVLLETDGWSRVSVNGQAGYIRSDLLEEVN
ncbi:MAG: SH3 domain-containing protein [Anaerococcus sp.]|nr:SH3 domain-containing protein [Anaerococcus sp.]